MSPGTRLRGALLGLALAAAAGCGGGGAVPAGAPQRIVCLTPSLVEVLYMLGLGERVVGVSNYSAWPPEVAEKPKLGGLYDPNLERIVTLKPDLAILRPDEEELAGELGRLGIGVLTVEGDTLAQVEESITTIARRCGVPEAGRELAARWRRGLAPDPLPGRARVMLALSRPPGRPAEVLVAGPGTFYDELLARMGAVNAFADSPASYPTVGLEEILARGPDAIVELRTEEVSPELAERLTADWRPFGQVPAVAAGCIPVLGGSHTMLPGPRLPRLYRELRDVLGACPAAAPSAPEGRGG